MPDIAQTVYCIQDWLLLSLHFTLYLQVLSVFFIYFLHHNLFTVLPVLFLAHSNVPCLPGLQTGNFKSLSDLTLDKELN